MTTPNIRRAFRKPRHSSAPRHSHPALPHSCDSSNLIRQRQPILVVKISSDFRTRNRAPIISPDLVVVVLPPRGTPAIFPPQFYRNLR